MRRAQKGSKKAKKEYERLEREIAEQSAKARSESEQRQEEIKVRWDLGEQQLRAAKNPTERKDIEQKLKKQKLRKLLNSVGKLADDEKIIDRIRESEELAEDENVFDRIRELVDLAVLQDGEIEYLMQFRRDWEFIQVYYPDQLENLYSASLMALMRQASPYQPKRKPQTEWDREWRGEYKLPGGIGLIEYEFGGDGEAAWRKLGSLSGLPYEPTCLDDIFAGGTVKMHNSAGEVLLIGDPHPGRILKPGLQRLFGMHRNRFLKNLHEPYDFRAVTKIMEALLNEKPCERKMVVRGRPRDAWPIDPDLRAPVLSRIEARINSLSVPQQIKPHIKAEFLELVHRHLVVSAKK